MKTIQKDILTVESGIICHQVNCMGVMGAGLALAIRNKWPNVFNLYVNHCNREPSPNKLLGQSLVVDAGDYSGLYVANLFGQYGFGRNEMHTNYNALERALFNLVSFASALNEENIYFPHGMGCGLGGGDWPTVLKIIEKKFPNAIICEKP